MRAESLDKKTKRLWKEFLLVVEAVNVDARKNLDKNNISAGKRARHGYRLLRKKAHELAVISVERDRVVQQERDVAKGRVPKNEVSK